MLSMGGQHFRENLVFVMVKVYLDDTVRDLSQSSILTGVMQHSEPGAVEVFQAIPDISHTVAPESTNRL